MEDKQSINPFESIFSDLRVIKNEMAELKSVLVSNSSQEKKFYSISEAAAKLGVAEITLYRNVQSGKIPSKKIGSRVMIPGSYLNR